MMINFVGSLDTIKPPVLMEAYLNIASSMLLMTGALIKSNYFEPAKAIAKFKFI